LAVLVRGCLGDRTGGEHENLRAARVEFSEKYSNPGGATLAGQRQEPNQEKYEILQFPDNQVRAKFDEYVEAWKQHEVAKSELQAFEASTSEPSPMASQFESVESFMEFNGRRREYVKHHEALRRNQDGSAARLKEIARVLGVLLPRNCTLIHHVAGRQYVIRNHRGHVTVASEIG